MTVLRVTFCILACLSAAAIVPIGTFFGWWTLVPIAAMAIFAFLMIAAKNGFSRPAPPPKPDFMNTEEENAKLRGDEDKK